MNQLTQQLKSGKMEILEVPFPVMNKGEVLVRNHYSVISAGTEGKTVSDARKGYIAKARSRQKEVKMVLEMIKSEGLRNTYGMVMNKLEAPSSLGYSCAGEVIAIASDIKDISVGDKVACGGSGAVHADVVAINRNLCVKLPDNVDLKHAAFTTIASIAIQGIRQADLRFGENCTVIGLGLIGLITIQVLKAAGIKTIGIDINPVQVQRAKEIGADMALERDHEGIISTIYDFTGGYGTDAVIITAGSDSLDPVEISGEISRKKGRVVVVGAVPTGFSRGNYFKKELSLIMSSSYGPGRYDPEYEEKGIDYPIGYVRFTENRNMQSFIDLLSTGRIDAQALISHTYNFVDAPEAYEIILNRKEHPLGVLIKYQHDREISGSLQLSNFSPEAELSSNVALIGAGNFAQNVVLPNLKGRCNLLGLTTSEGNISRYVAEKYKFEYCAEIPEKIMEDDRIGTVFVLTRHNSHSEFTIKALKSGKNVVVEKPLAMNMEQLLSVNKAYQESGRALMLGFNRRFSPLVDKICSLFNTEQKKSINIRINAGKVPADHWVHDKEIGGGRIIGEACHFIDLAGYLAGSKARNVQAFDLAVNPSLQDTFTINIKYQNGSIANISYYSNGNNNLPKERIEVFCDGTICLIDDFKNLKIINENSTRKIRLKGQDKGHRTQFKLITDALASGKEFPIPYHEIIHSSLVTLESVRSIKENRLIEIMDILEYESKDD